MVGGWNWGDSRYLSFRHFSRSYLGYPFSSLRKAAARMCSRLGIKKQALVKPSRHLDFSHPDMEAVRFFVQNCAQTHGVHPRMLCNFDQVCCVHFEHNRTNLRDTRPPQPPAANAALTKGPQQFQLPSVQRMLNAFKTSMGIETPMPASEDEAYVPTQPKLNADGHTVSVDYHRQCRATATLSWADGEMGPAYITAQTSCVPDALVRKLNAELKGDPQSSTGITR